MSFIDDLKNKAEDLADKAKDLAEDLGDKAKDAADTIGDKAKDAYADFAHKGEEAADTDEAAVESDPADFIADTDAPTDRDYS